MLKWLRDDGVLAHDEADKLMRRFGNSASGLHPLQRLGGASLVDVRDGRALDTDALARWLSARFELPYTAHRPAARRREPGHRGDVDGLCRDAARAARSPSTPTR